MLSQLDDDCLENIVQRLTDRKDYAAFSKVNRSIRDFCFRREWDGGPIPPCLMLSEMRGCSYRLFFSLHNRRFFVRYLPAAVGRRIWGSQHGWLVTLGAELDGPELMNPISQVCVQLPSFSTIQNQLAREDGYFMVQNLFVVKTEINHMEFLVFAILNLGDRLVFTRRPGDTGEWVFGEWVFVSSPKELSFKSVAYFKSQLYALCNKGSLIRIDINDSMEAKAEIVASHHKHEDVDYQPDHHEKAIRAYLVPSQDDLFGVIRYSSNDIGSGRTVRFCVYKFDFESWEWKSVSSIEDKAFFVGNGSSWSINPARTAKWSISPARTVKCQSNSIYYADDMDDGPGLDNGLYDLENWQTNSLWSGTNVPPSQPPATWITPSLTPSTIR